MTVILLRHGRSVSNTAHTLAGRSEGVELDEKGIAQAAALAQSAATAVIAAASSQTGASLQTSLANEAMNLQASLTAAVVTTLSASAAQTGAKLLVTAQKDAEMRTLAAQDALQLGSIAATAQALETAMTEGSAIPGVLANSWLRMDPALP
jgi:bisphosphoglycerate-dependent phosphoglycerate mutase